MKLIKSKDINLNYAAKIVHIQNFEPHPNPEVTNLKCTNIDGFSITLDKDEKPGLYIYFPVGSCINLEFLSCNNLYRDSSLNKDQTKKGYFDEKGRVKMIKLKGIYSEGFVLSVHTLSNWKEINMFDNISVNTIFDYVDDDLFVKKYIIKTTRQMSNTPKGSKKKLPKFNKMIEGQFNFHYSTTNIKNCPFVLHPDDIIHISTKYHGTSGVSSNIITKRPLTILEKTLKFIFPKLQIKDRLYGNIYSSRTVIKNKYINKNVTDGYYGIDIWKIANDQIIKTLNEIPKGMTLYYEILGYLPSGTMIQKKYDYGCKQPTNINEFINEVHYKIRIYRITITNPDGVVYEFNPKQVSEFCIQNGLIPVKELYYGYAKDLYPNLDISNHWNENFLNNLSKDKNFHMEMKSPDCNNKVPHEGVVLRIGNKNAYKLKCLSFLSHELKELDEGVSNIEDDQNEN